MFSESPYLRFALLLNLKMLDFFDLIVLLIVWFIEVPIVPVIYEATD